MITKERFNRVCAKDVTVKEYNDILNEVTDKINEIWRWICLHPDRVLTWWDFEDEQSFNPYDSQTFIQITGEWDWDNFCPYNNNGIPTELLWDENWQETYLKAYAEIKESVTKEKAKKKEAREKKKESNLKMTERIKAKLTPEEIKFLKLK